MYAPNAPLANIISKIIKGIGNDLAKTSETDATNSEEVCRDIQDYNDSETPENTPEDDINDIQCTEIHETLHNFVYYK